MTRPSRRALAACALVAVFPGALAAAVTLSGNPRGVAQFRAERRALGRVHTIAFRESGGEWIHADQGHPAYAGWLWSAGSAPAGWVHATVAGTVGTRDGRVRWTRAVITPRCPPGRQCLEEPVVVIGEPTGTWYAYGTLGRHTCFGRARGPFLATGSGLLNTRGDFQAPRTRDGVVSLTYRFPDVRRTVTETDTIVRATELPRLTVAVFSAARSAPGYAVRIGYRYRPATAAPRVDRCR